MSDDDLPRSLERCRVDKRLRESEQRYRALITATAQMIWTANPEGLTDPNAPTWDAYTGQSPEESAGWGWLNALHPDDRERTARAWKHAVETKTIFEAEYRVRRHDGVYGTFLARGVPVFDDDGQVCEWIGICIDITERKRAEEERDRLLRREQEARAEAIARASELEAIFESITDAVMVYDRDGGVVGANSAARSLLALDEQGDLSAASRSGRVTRYGLRDEHGHLLDPEMWPVSRMLRGEVLTGRHGVDVLLQTIDGRHLQLNVSGSPVRDAAGHIVGAVMVLRDVTERRRLERRTHDVLNALLAMAEALVLPVEVDQRGGAMPAPAGGIARRLVELTRSVIGCRRASVVTVDLAAGVQHPVAVVGLSPELEQRWWERMEGAPLAMQPEDQDALERLRSGEVLVFDTDDPRFRDRPNPFKVRTLLVAPLRVGDQFIGLLALDHDGQRHEYTREERALAGAVAKLVALVIERERLLREAAQAHATELALREANQRMDEFLSIASHELKTPLTTIKGNLQLAQLRARRAAAEDADDAGALVALLASLHQLLDRTDRQVSRLNRLVDDLLDVSRIQAGHLDMHPVAADLTAVVREAVEEQRQAWPGRTIVLDIPGTAIPVRIDADRIGQVVTNYLTNALKYSDEDRPVAVALRVEDGQARVAVRDEGPGLAPEHIVSLWDRFYRVEGVAVRSGTHSSAVGLGLGLYISRTIIEHHGGRVGVESTPGQGSTFWFMLPLAERP